MRLAGEIFPPQTLQLALGGNYPNFSELGASRAVALDYDAHGIDGGRPLTQEEFREIMREIRMERGDDPRMRQQPQLFPVRRA